MWKNFTHRNIGYSESFLFHPAAYKIDNIFYSRLTNCYDFSIKANRMSTIEFPNFFHNVKSGWWDGIISNRPRRPYRFDKIIKFTCFILWDGKICKALRTNGWTVRNTKYEMYEHHVKATTTLCKYKISHRHVSKYIVAYVYDFIFVRGQTKKSALTAAICETRKRVSRWSEIKEEKKIKAEWYTVHTYKYFGVIATMNGD